MLIASIGPVLIIVGQLMGAVGTIMTVAPKLVGIINAVKTAFVALNTTMLANPIFLVIVAITALVAAFLYLWNTSEEFRQFWKDLWSDIKSGASLALETIENGFDEASSFIKNLAKSAFTWGTDLIDGLVGGIKNSIGNVKGAVKDVANTIRSFLHFSVPEEGPLTDYETWMPDFMRGLTKGIENSKGMVSKAIQGVASDMVINPKLATEGVGMIEDWSRNRPSENFGNTNVIGQSDTPNGDIVIPIYIGNTMIDEVVVDAQQRMNLKSEGR